MLAGLFAHLTVPILFWISWIVWFSKKFSCVDIVRNMSTSNYYRLTIIHFTCFGCLFIAGFIAKRARRSAQEVHNTTPQAVDTTITRLKASLEQRHQDTKLDYYRPLGDSTVLVLSIGLYERPRTLSHKHHLHNAV